MKTIIITGANGNLGKAVTQKFLQSHYRVIATVVSEKDQLSMPKHENLSVYILDLTDEEATANFVKKTIDLHGNIYAAVMLVGGFAMGSIEQTKSADLSNMYSLNFETAYHLTQPLYQHMQENQSGRLIYIGARPALDAQAGSKMIAYALSKSLIFKLAEFINAESKNTAVTATVVVPSTIDTPMNRAAMPDTNPDNWVKPESLADIMAFICSDEANNLRETVMKVYNNA